MKPKSNKESFIDILSSMTPKEINEFIARNGKEAKMISPITFGR